RWVAETQPRDAVLLDRKPLVAFYSERRWVPLPRIGPDELLAVARHAGARLVVLDSREFLFDRPGLIPLLWGPPPPGLDVLRDFDAAPADRLRILVANERGGAAVSGADRGRVDPRRGRGGGRAEPSGSAARSRPRPLRSGARRSRGRRGRDAVARARPAGPRGPAATAAAARARRHPERVGA